MKKLLFIASIAAFSAFTAAPAVASVDETTVITCPVTSGPAQLANFGGNYIAGPGSETVGGTSATDLPDFRSQGTLPAGIPGRLTTYSASGAIFNDADPKNIFVTCSYTSSSSFPSFSVSYPVKNGSGAHDVVESSNNVSFIVPVGFRG